jgi:hypothetical protein
VYPAPRVSRGKHHTWRSPPEPLSSSPPKALTPAGDYLPAKTEPSTAKSETNTTRTEPEVGTKKEPKTGTEIETKPKGVGNDTTPGEIETRPKGIEIETTPIRIQLTQSATLLEKRQIPACVKLALSFDDELQPLYSEMKRAKIMNKSM